MMNEFRIQIFDICFSLCICDIQCIMGVDYHICFATMTMASLLQGVVTLVIDNN